MIVLGIETSSRWSGVALADEGGLVGTFHMQEGGRAEHIHLLMVRLLEASGFATESIGGVAVSLGPGSFTGLRIGLGAAKGIALSTGCAIVGIALPSLLAESAAPWDGPVAVWIDAGRGEVHGTLFNKGRELSPGRTAPPEEHLDRLDGETALFIGSGALRHRSLVENRFRGNARFLEERRNHPDAARVVMRGRELLLDGRGDSVDDLEPLYLRSADARRPEKR